VMASAVHSIHPSIIIFNSCGLLAASCWITGEIDKTLSGWTLRVFIFHLFLVFLFFFIRYFFIYYFTRQEQQQTGREREKMGTNYELWFKKCRERKKQKNEIK
jgi:phosphotransferase system  glucose/maltose/N-acetylglucosamine-specific IIC component